MYSLTFILLLLSKKKKEWGSHQLLYLMKSGTDLQACTGWTAEEPAPY